MLCNKARAGLRCLLISTTLLGKPIFAGEHVESTGVCAGRTATQLNADLSSAYSADSLSEVETRLKILLADHDALDSKCSFRGEISSEIGALALRAGDPLTAEKIVNEGLANLIENNKARSVNAGLNHFVLASILSGRADYMAASSEYKRALEILTAFGNEHASAVSGVYQDLGLMQLHLGDLRSAEEDLQQALKYQASAPNVSAERITLGRDAMVHLRFAQGRLSDAQSMLRQMADEHGNDPTVSTRVRAHIYRDLGELSVATGRPDDAIVDLKTSLSLMEEKSRAPGYAITLAILARAHVMRQDVVSAGDALRTAAEKARDFQISFPEDAAVLEVAYGNFLNQRKKWAEARQTLKLAVNTGRDSRVHVDGLRNLIEADHHLHERREESELRRQLKQLQKSQPNEVVARDTVDVLSFAAPAAH